MLGNARLSNFFLLLTQIAVNSTFELDSERLVAGSLLVRIVPIVQLFDV